MIFFAVYYGTAFEDDTLVQYLVDMQSNRCVFGRSANEVIETDRRNNTIYRHPGSDGTAVGISDYPQYCRTTPSTSWWIASFETVRVRNSTRAMTVYYAMFNTWRDNASPKPSACSFCRHKEDVISTIFVRSAWHRSNCANTITGLTTWYASRNYFVVLPCSLVRINRYQRSGPYAATGNGYTSTDSY